MVGGRFFSVCGAEDKRSGGAERQRKRALKNREGSFLNGRLTNEVKLKPT